MLQQMPEEIEHERLDTLMHRIKSDPSDPTGYDWLITMTMHYPFLYRAYWKISPQTCYFSQPLDACIVSTLASGAYVVKSLTENINSSKVAQIYSEMFMLDLIEKIHKCYACPRHKTTRALSLVRSAITSRMHTYRSPVDFARALAGLLLLYQPPRVATFRDKIRRIDPAAIQREECISQCVSLIAWLDAVIQGGVPQLSEALNNNSDYILSLHQSEMDE